MAKPRRPAATLFAAALLSVSGCGGTTRTIDESFPAARDWFEGTPASIAVLPGDYVPLLSLFVPEAQKESSAAAAVNVATQPVSASCGSRAATGCSEGALAAPLGTLVQAIVNSADLENWSKYGNASLNRAGEQLGHSLADRRPQLLISHAVAQRIRARTKYDAALKAFRGHPEEFVPEGRFNGVVEIGLTQFGLAIDGDFDQSVEDPRVALKIGVRADVYSMRDRAFVGEATGGWEYLGPAYRLSTLMAENGRLLNEEIERAAKTLAKRIVN